MDYVKTHMFSGWWTGKMQRKPFILMMLTIALFFFLFIAVFVLGMVGAENGVAQWFGVSGIDAQNLLRDALTTPAYIFVYAVVLLLIVITTALYAKRLRDIGLPGWPIAIALTVIGDILLGHTVVTPVVLLVLAVTPSAMFNLKSPPLMGR